MLTIPTYSIATKAKGRQEYAISSYCYEVVEVPADEFIALVDGSSKVTSRTVSVSGTGFYRIFYWSNGTTLAVYSSAAYSCVQSVVAPAISNGILTLKTPNFLIRGHTTYFTSTYYNALTDVRYQYIFEVYRVPKDTANINGWGVFTNAQHIIDCVNSTNHKLT